MYGSYQRYLLSRTYESARPVISDRERALNFVAMALSYSPKGGVSTVGHGDEQAALFAHSKGWVYPVYDVHKRVRYVSNLDADQIRVLRSLA